MRRCPRCGEEVREVGRERRLAYHPADGGVCLGTGLPEREDVRARAAGERDAS